MGTEYICDKCKKPMNVDCLMHTTEIELETEEAILCKGCTKLLKKWLNTK